MEEEQKSIDWRENISDSSKATLKIQDGESSEVVLMSEGEKRTHSDFGDSIVFEVQEAEETKNFYVNPQNYALLRQFKELGKLVGVKVKISRVGSKKSDTRYTVEKVEEKEE